jgi:hypothetical protein
MTEELKIPAKRAPMPEGYDGVTMMKEQGSPTLQGVGGVHVTALNAPFASALFQRCLQVSRVTSNTVCCCLFGYILNL